MQQHGNLYEVGSGVCHFWTVCLAEIQKGRPSLLSNQEYIKIT